MLFAAVAQAQQPAPNGQESPPAQDQSAPAGAEVAPDARAAQARLEAIKLQIDKIEAALRREGLNDAELAALRDEIEPEREAARTVEFSLQPQLQAVNTRIRELGSPPAEGAPPESAELAAARARQRAVLAVYEGIVRQAALLKVRAEQIQEQITSRRRALFADRIFERRLSALHPLVWVRAAGSFPTWLRRLELLAVEGGSSVLVRIDWQAVIALAGAVLLLGLLVFPVRRLLLRFGARDPALTQPGALRKTSAAMWLALVYALVPWAALSFLLWVSTSLGLLPARLERLGAGSVEAVFLFCVIEGLAWAIIAPRRPSWRLISLRDAAAIRLHRLVILTGAVYAIDIFLGDLDRVLFAPVAGIIAREIVTSLILAGLVAWALRVFTAAGEAPLASGKGEPSFNWTWIRLLAWLAVAAVPLAAFFGYLSLASFIASQLIAAAIILAALALALRFADDALTVGLEREGGAGDALARSLGVSRRVVVQGGVLLSGGVRVILLFVAITLLLVPWGIESKDIFGWVRVAFFGFGIGDIRISLSTILIALAIFLLGLMLTRVVQHWLQQRFLPQTRLDVGVSNSLTTAFGYLGLIAAATVAFTFVGLDLSSLALVAGALGIGIGFGLQSIVNNFVSGLILLAERPIKTGDWIVVGDEEGYVRKISVRSTEIETFDRATVIVPNSDLVSGVVKNWMHADRLGRIIVPVGVAYDSDPEQVREILLDCADKHPAVLREPKPNVFFMDFGASSLDFELRAYLGDVDTSLTTRSELRFAIFAALKQAGITIPFPQQDIHLRDIERIENLLAKARRTARSGGAGGKSAPRRGGGNRRQGK